MEKIATLLIHVRQTLMLKSIVQTKEKIQGDIADELLRHFVMAKFKEPLQKKGSPVVKVISSKGQSKKRKRIL